MQALAFGVIGCGLLCGPDLSTAPAHPRLRLVAGCCGVVLVGHRLVAGLTAAGALEVLFGLPLDGGAGVLGYPLGVVGDLEGDQLPVGVSEGLVDRTSSSTEEDGSGDSSGSAVVEDAPFAWDISISAARPDFGGPTTSPFA